MGVLAPKTTPTIVDAPHSVPSHRSFEYWIYEARTRLTSFTADVSEVVRLMSTTRQGGAPYEAVFGSCGATIFSARFAAHVEVSIAFMPCACQRLATHEAEVRTFCATIFSARFVADVEVSIAFMPRACQRLTTHGTFAVYSSSNSSPVPQTYITYTSRKPVFALMTRSMWCSRLNSISWKLNFPCQMNSMHA